MAVKGYFDGVRGDIISGWAYDTENPQKRLTIYIFVDDKKIGEVKASIYRQDLEKHKIGDGKYGFVFKLPPEAFDGKKHIIRVFAEKTELKSSPKEVVLVKKGYQTFEDQVGDSNSYEKLRRLYMPKNMNGLKVLDLGCNEGFFVFECAKRGAWKCVGIDMNREFINRAKERAEKYGLENVCEFIVDSWWNIPNEKFDIILFLSSMHYESDPAGLFRHLLNYLKPNGKLILECGVAPGRGPHYVAIERWDGRRRYPTYELLVEYILKDYYVKHMGPSVQQSGDPLPRHVFHCNPKKPAYILLSGPPAIGKTSLSRLLAKPHEVLVYNSDYFFDWHKSQARINSRKTTKILDFLEKIDNTKRDKAIASLEKGDLIDDFVDLFVDTIPSEADIIIVEGFIFDSEKIKELIAKKLRDRGGVVWELGPHMSRDDINKYINFYEAIGLQSTVTKIKEILKIKNIL